MLEGKSIAILVEEGFEDSNIITSLKPADLPQFNKAIIDASL